MTVYLAAFAVDRTVEEVAGVELYARLVRVDVERAAAHRVDDAGGVVPWTPSVEHPVVVVAAGDLELLVRHVDPRADRRRLAEVEGCALDRWELTGRDQGRIDRR